MTTPPFSQEWAFAWRDALNDSAAYRKASTSWRWPIVVVAEDVAAWRLDLYEGICRSIRVATDSDLEQTDYVLSGQLDEWERVLSGELTPMVALMQGTLRLKRGSMLTLARHTKAAHEMLSAARLVSTASAVTTPGTHSGNGQTVPTPRQQDARRQSFRTTSAGGLRRDSFPMQLYQKAKKLGIWDPSDLDFEQDKVDWAALSIEEKDVLLRLIAMFQAGEEAVTLDLLPLIRVVASEGRLEEEMYLTTFLFEEAKHTEFFRRFLDEVAEASGPLDGYHTPAYRRLFYEELPTALARLDGDSSKEAQLEASVTYNMVVEGTLAETGYHALYEVLDRRSMLPGLRTGTGLVQRDESRHIAYGIYLIKRLINNDTGQQQVFQRRMNELLPIATSVISELFAVYDPMPFDLQEEDFLKFAAEQFAKRTRRIESGSD